MDESLWIKQVATLSQLVRIQGSRFAEALTKEELSIICFIYRVTEGERERRPLPIDVFQYLEERGEIDYSRPEQLIDLMRLLQREKWARETQQLVERHRLQTSLQYPIEESSVILRPREIATQIRDKRKAIPLNLPEDETDGLYKGRVCNHTCTKCNEQLRVRLQSPQLAEEIQKTINKFCATNFSCQSDEKEVDHDVGVRVQQTTSPFIRKGSTMSHKSTRSSGYGSMVIEQFENPLIMLEETDTVSTAISPTLSSIASSGPDQELLYPQLGASKPLSRQSSTEEYYTADEATSEESTINTKSVSKQDTTLCHNTSSQQHIREHSAAETTTIVAPSHNREVIIGSMEMNTADLKKGLESSRSMTKAYKSYPFPSIGPHFQIQLSSSDSTDYAVHLLTKPSLTSSPSYVHMSVRVCVYDGDHDVPLHATPSSLIYTSTHEIDNTATSPPPTTTPSLTTQESTTGYTQYLATFPHILNLNELKQIMNRTLVIKTFLEYNAVFPQ